MIEQEKILLSIDATKGLSKLIEQREKFINAIIKLSEVKVTITRDDLYDKYNEQIENIDSLINSIASKMDVISFHDTDKVSNVHINN